MDETDTDDGIAWENMNDLMKHIQDRLPMDDDLNQQMPYIPQSWSIHNAGSPHSVTLPRPGSMYRSTRPVQKSYSEKDLASMSQTTSSSSVVFEQGTTSTVSTCRSEYEGGDDEGGYKDPYDDLSEDLADPGDPFKRFETCKKS